MGGKLIQSKFGMPEKRINREEYHRIYEDVKFNCNAVYDIFYINTPRYLRDKQTFGDIDIVTDLQIDQIKKILRERYNNPKYSINANVISFPLDGFQVDMVSVDTKYALSTIAFMNWGDTGNLIGRIANGIGVNFGNKGLFYKLEKGYFSGHCDNHNLIDKIYLSDSMFEVCRFLGLDYHKWLFEGFDNEMDVFKWIESSAYFNPRLFFFEELDHENRTRNKKRPMYARFVEYITKKYKDKVYPKLGKSYYFPRVLQYFPELPNKIEDYRIDYEQNYIFTHKFNGDIVKELTGLEGPDLGKLIVKLKNSQADFKYWVINSSQIEIEQKILELNKND